MDRNRPALVSRGRRYGWYGLLLVPLAFLLVFFFYPLGSIFVVSFTPEGQFDLSTLSELVTSSYYLETLWFTIWQAVLSTVLTLALALPGAYVFARFRFPGKQILLALATLPFVLPTVVVAAAFTALIGPRGLVNEVLMNLFALEQPPIQLQRTLTLILIAHVFYNYAIALRIISSFWANQSPRIEEAARVLGARGWQVWWAIRLPLLRPAILAAAVLVFIFTFTSFGVILILGGLEFATLEVEIYRQATGLFNLPVAAALSLVQIGLMFALMVVYTRLQRQTATDLQAAREVTRAPQTWREKLLVRANLVLIGGLLLAPLLALVARSLTGPDGSLTFAAYTGLTSNPRGSVLFVPPTEAIWNSLGFALLTTGLALLLGVLSAVVLARRDQTPWTHWLDPLFMLPLAASAVTLGFGYIVAPLFAQTGLRSAPLLIPLAHTLVATPFVVRSVLPALRGITPSIREGARVLGASPWQVWRLIDLPLMSRGLVVGATFAFTVSMGEFGASIFIARPDTPTMPIVIFRLLGEPGATNYAAALALSTVLMGVCAVSFIVIERARTAGIGEF